MFYNIFVLTCCGIERFGYIFSTSYPIKVAKGLSAPVATEDQKAIENKNSDIRHIYLGDKQPSFTHPMVVLQLYYWMLYLGLFLATVAVIIIYRRKAVKKADVVGQRNAKASKVAKKRLKTADQFLKQGNGDKFYEEMLRALWGYLSDKLNIPTSQLSRQNIASTLEAKGYAPEAADPIIAVLDECEMARYTPESSSRMDAVYENGVEAINKLESSVAK